MSGIFSVFGRENMAQLLSGLSEYNIIPGSMPYLVPVVLGEAPVPTTPNREIRWFTK